MNNKKTYGLSLTENSKTGPAFSLARAFTCINKTPTCEAACYGNGFRYQSSGQRSKRNQNYQTVEFLLSAGGIEALAENLVDIIDKAKPFNWVAAKFIQAQATWTLRIHDVGDFHSSDYVKAWTLALSLRPYCQAWFYTRSFLSTEIFQSLTELASLPNCKGFISIDKDNHQAAIDAYLSKPSVWNLAILQDEAEHLPPEMIRKFQEHGISANAICFPKHRAGRHVAPVDLAGLTICPQVLGALPLESNPQELKPCQICRFCLPASVAMR
ncbi:MAG: hypothetical protein K2X77_10135 [Candidatus Obscuribacterales bacterium]|jgi:hypothetical protein|nr:hypothetical protein [Candidatus Obscuribacterales bacterium]